MAIYTYSSLPNNPAKLTYCTQKYSNEQAYCLSDIYNNLSSIFDFNKNELLLHTVNYGKYLIISILRIYNGNVTSYCYNINFYYEKK
jgi:hypothetical protein